MPGMCVETTAAGLDKQEVRVYTTPSAAPMPYVMPYVWASKQPLGTYVVCHLPMFTIKSSC